MTFFISSVSSLDSCSCSRLSHAQTELLVCSILPNITLLLTFPLPLQPFRPELLLPFLLSLTQKVSRNLMMHLISLESLLLIKSPISLALKFVKSIPCVIVLTASPQWCLLIPSSPNIWTTFKAEEPFNRVWGWKQPNGHWASQGKSSQFCNGGHQGFSGSWHERVCPLSHILTEYWQ